MLQTPVAIEVAPRVVQPERAGESGGGSGGGGTAAPVVGAVEPARAGGGVDSISVGAIRPSRFQARRMFDEAPLKTLADSIRAAGVMQPVIVRKVGESGGGGGVAQYELIAGERRWRAAQIAGLERVPALVRELGDEEAAEWGLIENVQREDLNAMDKAHALRAMSERFGLSHAKVAEKVGLERATVANLVRLTELEADVAELISAGALTGAHGKALLSMGAGAERVRIAREAARGEWPVRKVEAEVKRTLAGGAAPESQEATRDLSVDAKRAVVLDLERRLSQQLGTKVLIQTSGGGKGKITIDFYGLDHFDGLMAKMGVK